MTPCRPLKLNARNSGGTCWLHLQGRRISQTRNQHEADSKHSLFFYPEDGGDVSL
jgi:hypothetical protein